VLRFKPTIFIGIGELGCDVVEQCQNMISQANPDEMQMIRSLGICMKTISNTAKRSFHVENLSGFIPNKIANRSFTEAKDDLFSWFHSNVNKERLVRLNEIIQSDPSIRPLGRMALLLKAKIIQKTIANFIHDIRLIWKEINDPIHLVIVSPVSEGLGSSTVIDLSFIAKAAANTEKSTLNVITIFILDRSNDKNKARQLKEANSYAALMEVCYFQDRPSQYANFIPVEPKLSSDECKTFNISYLLNVGKDSRAVDENMIFFLSSGIKLLCISPQDSARRILIDQVGADAINFGTIGTAVLKNNITEVVSICSKKLCSELLRLILGVDFEKQDEKTYLFFNIENFSPTFFIEDVEKKVEESINTIPEFPWRKIKKICETDFITLRESIFKKRIGEIDTFFEAHLDEMKNKLFNALNSHYIDFLSTSNEGIKGHNRLLKETSEKLDIFLNQIQKSVMNINENSSDSSTNFEQLFAEIRKASKRTFLRELLDIFRKEWHIQKKELVERFNSILKDCVKKDFKSTIRKTSLKIYNEIQNSVRNIEIDIKQKGQSLNSIIIELEEEIKSETEQLSLNIKNGSPIFEAKHIENIYNKYKPKKLELFETIKNNNPDFFVSRDECNHEKLKPLILSICSRYYNHLIAVGIPNFIQNERIISLKEVITRIYSLSCPKVEEEALDRNDLYERNIIMSGIRESQFKNLKEEVGLDCELIFDGNLLDEIHMLREWYGIKLSKLSIFKDMELSYIYLRKENFPLHTVETDHRLELPLISYPITFFKDMKTLYLVGLALKCIDFQNGKYIWSAPGENDVVLGTDNEIAFLSVIENTKIRQKIKDCINRTIADKFRGNAKKSVKSLLKELDIKLFTEKEMGLIGMYFEDMISK